MSRHALDSSWTRRHTSAASASAATVIVVGGMWLGAGDADAGESYDAPPSPSCDLLVDAALAADAADGGTLVDDVDTRAALAVSLCDGELDAALSLT